MKARWKWAVLGVVAAALVFSSTGAAFAATSGEGATKTSVAASLSPHVQKHLVTLREREKLGRDVYASDNRCHTPLPCVAEEHSHAKVSGPLLVSLLAIAKNTAEARS